MRRWAVRAMMMFYSVLWIGGIVTYSVSPSLRPGDAWAAAAFLLVAGTLSLVIVDRPAAVMLLAASLAAFASEILGVATGLVFGSYQYSGMLGFSVFQVPVAIAAAWIILLAYVWHSVTHLKMSPLPGALLGAAWMTTIDLLIDPLAAGPLSYWRWQEGGLYFGVPLSNFAGWFGISFILLLFLRRRPLHHPGARLIGASVIAFFTYVAAVHALWIPGLIGAGLLGIDGWLFRGEWKQAMADGRTLLSQLQNPRMRHEH